LSALVLAVGKPVPLPQATAELVVEPMLNQQQPLEYILEPQLT
jgi:hypothetical protein